MVRIRYIRELIINDWNWICKGVCLLNIGFNIRLFIFIIIGFVMKNRII